MGYFKKFNQGGIPFMEGRNKGSNADIVGERLHIADFAFLNTKNGRTAVISYQEKPGMFFFGPASLAEMLQEVEADGMRDALATVEVELETRVSKNGNNYYGFNVYEAE